MSSENREAARKPSVAQRLVDLTDHGGAQLFHTPERAAFVTIQARETVPLRSKGMRQWLAARFHEQTGAVPGAQAVQDALQVLEGKAVHDGAEHAVSVRIAEVGGAVYLDLGDPAFRVVAITAAGWTITDSAPVKFWRPRSLLPLPMPERGGHVDELEPFLNIGSDGDWSLLVAFLLACLRARGPYPVLAIGGEQGSAKSTASRIIKALVDPAAAPLRAIPRDEHALMISARNGHLLAWDNLSGLPPWFSDALCRLSTGGGIAARELYCDHEEVVLDAQRPTVINGIGESITRSDLLDRAILLNLPTIAAGRHRTEEDLWCRFEAAQPRILGALLDAVAGGLARLDSVHLERSPRLADFARWAVATEPATGNLAGSFLAAYEQNRGQAHDLAVEGSDVAECVRRLMANRASYEASASELLEDLANVADDGATRRKTWPGNGRALSAELHRIAPNLRALGINFTRAKTTNGRRVMRLEVLDTDSGANGTSGANFPYYSNNGEKREGEHKDRFAPLASVAPLAPLNDDEPPLPDSVSAHAHEYAEEFEAELGWR